ncbi:alpha/beta fold hydrolase [Sneathiella glossodoripedis]|uniref:alpha/beta fold hydrolase n=1 Tax=Sneathiella glossodoripedis TaxID=418853 RepID=UPI000687E4D2|nr:alpha/beta hydrolase [Sneathiella glossodoripedis]
MTLDWTDNPVKPLKVGVHELEYICLGPPPQEAPTLILLHEGLGCVRLWRDFPLRLAQATGLGVFAYSRAGYGQSSSINLPRPLDYMSIEANEIFPELLAKAGIDQFILVGHSDGATIAALFSGHRADDRLMGAVLMAPHFFAEECGLSEIEKITKDYKCTDLKSRLGRYHKDPDVAFYGWSDSWLHPDFRNWNVAECLNSINVPVLAIQGRSDSYGSLIQLGEIMNRCQNSVSLQVLENCGHSPFLEEPDKVLTMIRDFIASQIKLTGQGNNGY